MRSGNQARNNKQVRKKKYQKIPLEIANKLNEMVFVQGYKIKDAAKELQLNYASAKNIIKKFRKTIRENKTNQIQEAKRCSYKQKICKESNVLVVSFVCGDIMKYIKLINNKQ